MNLSNKNVVHIKKDNIEYLQFKRLIEYNNMLNHAYSLGTNLNFRTSKTDKKPLDDEEFKKNCNDYKILCENIGEHYINIVKTNQEHTDNIAVVNNKINIDKPDFNLDVYNRIDGLNTNKNDIILATTNADCILLLFFDPIKKVIANVHSGWRGTLKRISVKAVREMVDKYNCNCKDIICCICPSIRKCHFEVREDVKSLFEAEFKEIDNIIEYNSKKGKWNIDMALINKEILKKEGLTENNIIDSEICSVCSSKLIHSYRVEQEGYGLNTALINLKSQE